MSRVQLDDTPQSAIIKMCDGNPGALTVLINLYKEEATIDPDSALGGFGTLLALDGMGIYGSHIWILFKDICGSSLLNVVAVFRAHQFGFITKETIVSAVETMDRAKIDCADLLLRVRAELPAFGKQQ